MWCITCLAEGSRESPASSGKSDHPEYDLAGRVNAPTSSSPHFVVAKAKTLPWPSLAAFYWERSSCITGLTGALQLCTATVYSLSSLLSFSFCFIVSSLVVLSLSNCPHLKQAAFFCHLFYVSLSSFPSAVRRYFVSDMFSYGLS